MTTTTITIADIEAKAKAFSAERAVLAERLQALRDDLEAAKRRRLQGIKNALARVQATHEDLRAAVEATPHLFDQPKTRILHGIRVGWMKQRGKLEFGDAATLCKAIRKHYSAEADTLIKVTEAPIRAALAALPARDLQKLGIAITDDTDTVVIKPADSELDKLMAALINDTELEALAT